MADFNGFYKKSDAQHSAVYTNVDVAPPAPAKRKRGRPAKKQQQPQYLSYKDRVEMMMEDVDKDDAADHVTSSEHELSFDDNESGWDSEANLDHDDDDGYENQRRRHSSHESIRGTTAASRWDSMEANFGDDDDDGWYENQRRRDSSDKLIRGAIPVPQASFTSRDTNPPGASIGDILAGLDTSVHNHARDKSDNSMRGTEAGNPESQ